MGIVKTLIVIVVAMIMAVVCFGEGVPRFELMVVDGAYPGNGKPGWSAWGDVDGDGDVDVLAGGGRAVQWYEAPGWERHAIEVETEVGGNGAIVMDVDGDGDLDLITALFMKELVWYENPGAPGSFDGAVKGKWSKHVINGEIRKYNHDMAWGDIDGDGKGELVGLFTGGGVYWYQPGEDVKGLWGRKTIVEPLEFPHAGLAMGDMDGDGDVDVVASNSWYENAGGEGWDEQWVARKVFAKDVSNVAVCDVNGDGRLDVVGSQGFYHPDGKVFCAYGPGAEKDGVWREVLVGEGLDGPESIWAGDVDGDGRVEIMTAEMGTSAGAYSNMGALLVYRVVDGGGEFVKHVVASGTGMTTRLNAVDIDGDGDLDFTADGNAENHIYLWVNLSK